MRNSSGPGGYIRCWLAANRRMSRVPKERLSNMVPRILGADHGKGTRPDSLRARKVKLFTRLGSSIEASRRDALDNGLFDGASSLPGRGRGGRFLCPDGFSRSESA